MTSHRPENIPSSIRVTMHRDDPDVADGPDEELPPLLYYTTCIARGSDPTTWANERGDYWLDPWGHQALPVGSEPEPEPEPEPVDKYTWTMEYDRLPLPPKPPGDEVTQALPFVTPYAGGMDEWTQPLRELKILQQRPMETISPPPIYLTDLRLFPAEVTAIIEPPELDFAKLRKRHLSGGST